MTSGDPTVKILKQEGFLRLVPIHPECATGRGLRDRVHVLTPEVPSGQGLACISWPVEYDSLNRRSTLWQLNCLYCSVQTPMEPEGLAEGSVVAKQGVYRATFLNVAFQGKKIGASPLGAPPLSISIRISQMASIMQPPTMLRTSKTPTSSGSRSGSVRLSSFLQ